MPSPWYMRFNIWMPLWQCNAVLTDIDNRSLKWLLLICLSEVDISLVNTCYTNLRTRKFFEAIVNLITENQNHKAIISQGKIITWCSTNLESRLGSIGVQLCVKDNVHIKKYGTRFRTIILKLIYCESTGSRILLETIIGDLHLIWTFGKIFL